LEKIKKNIDTNNYKLPNLTCWKIVPPKRELGKNESIATGHIFSSETDSINESNIIEVKKHIACIPVHCYRKVRNWLESDIVFEHKEGGKYYAVFFNPHTNSLFGGTSKSGPEKPYNFVGKVISCPERKSIIVEDIIDTDKISRRKCNANKRIKDSTPIVPRESDIIEDKFMQERIYKQSKKIEALKQYSQRLNKENETAKIVNQEYNRSRLQNYVSKQRELIDRTLNKLEKGRNNVEINVKYPVKILDTLIDCVITGTCGEMPHSDKIRLLSKLTDIKQKVKTDSSYDYKVDVADALEGCPQFDLSGYIKKDPPCFGCTNLDY
jgi:hypothetical protein